MDCSEQGTLAENINVALLRFPIVTNADVRASKMTNYQQDMHVDTTPNEQTVRSMHNCDPIFITTLKDLCDHLHSGYLLDGQPHHPKRSIS